MQTFRKQIWVAGLALLATATGGITAARTAPQTQSQGSQQTITEAERLKALERIRQEMLKNAGVQPQPAQAQPAQTPSHIPPIVQRPPQSGDAMTLEFDGQELYGFITQIADALGITPIVIDPDVKGVVTLHASMPIPKQDILHLFNLILKNNNAALVKAKGIYQIVPISQGLKEGLEVVTELPPQPPPKPEPDKEPAKKEESPQGDGAKPPAQAAAQTPPGQPPAQAPPAAAAGQTPPPAVQAKPPAAPPAAAAPQAESRPAAQDVPRLATHVIRVEFIPVSNLLDPLKLFMTDGGVIMPYERLNMLIVTDYSDSVQKVLEIVHLLDNSYLDPDLIDMVEIKNNASADVLEDLKKIFGGGKDASTGIYMVSLDRINTIMVMANSKRALEEVKRWITRLDSTTGRSVQTFIYTVENSTASNIAMVLSLLFGGGDSSAAGGMNQQSNMGAGGIYSQQQQGLGSTGRTGLTGTGAGLGTSGMRALGASSLGQGGGFSGGSTFGGQGYGGGYYGQGAGMGNLGGGNVGGPRLNQGMGMTAQWLNGGQFVGLQGIVRIVADDINNSLIIQASSADYNYLLDTIKRMDVLPRQAIIDARIFEIDLTDALSFGVSATLQARASGDHLTTGSLSNTTGALSAASFAFVGNAREILMSLDALRQKTKVRILEAPSVLALDGTPARINVGGSVPVPTQSYVAPAGGATTGIAYRDTGTSLLITPRISASGTVTLYVYHEVSSVGPPVGDAPSFNQTNVETTLAVKDGETVAIAGLIRENNNTARNGVPFLSDIPLLGALFGRTTRSATRSELLIMITPHVIKTPERFREMTEEIKDSLRNVRKMVDSTQKQIMEDQQDARKERTEKLLKEEKKSQPPAPVKKDESPAAPPAPVKKRP